jgi:hypothetical protein
MKTNKSFLIVFRSILPKMINFSENNSRVNQNTHFMFSNVFENSAIQEITGKTSVALVKPHENTAHVH